MALGKRNPFEELEQLFDRMNRQFEQSGDAEGGMWGMNRMSIDVEDRDDELIVTADLPGFEKEDLEVKLSEDVLKIEADREEQTEQTGDEGEYIRQERRQRSMSRSVRLPEPVNEDEVDARYKNGVLTITLPKRHADSESRSIDIS